MKTLHCTVGWETQINYTLTLSSFNHSFCNRSLNLWYLFLKDFKFKKLMIRVIKLKRSCKLHCTSLFIKFLDKHKSTYLSTSFLTTMSENSLPSIFFTAGNINHSRNILIQKLVTNLAKDLCRTREWLQHLNKWLQLQYSLNVNKN